MYFAFYSILPVANVVSDVMQKECFQDHSDIVQLLAPENIDRTALIESAKEVAYFGTEYTIPNIELARTHRGLEDVAIFEFATRQEAEHSCLELNQKGRKLLVCLVGDSLLEVHAV